MINKKDVIEIKDGVIPYDKIKDQKDITFVIITKDEKVLEESIRAISKVKDEYKDKDFNVVISSSYEKLHTLSNGKF